jgi:hypothetical protein
MKTSNELDIFEAQLEELSFDLEDGPTKLAALEKAAFSPRASQAMTSIGIGAATTLGSALGGTVINSIRSAMTKGKNYKGMLDVNPDLGKKDSKQVQLAFNTLSRFNPHYASDPSVAGAYVRQQLDMERVDLNSINSLVAANKSISGGQRPTFDPAGWHQTGSNLLGNVQSEGDRLRSHMADAKSRAEYEAYRRGSTKGPDASELKRAFGG